MSNMQEQHLQEALSLLPWLERSCLLFSMNTDFTQEEMASILDVTEEEVSRAVLQGREHFDQAYHLVSGTLARLDLSHIDGVPDPSEEALTTALQDTNWENRVVAVKVIGETKGEKRLELLEKALQDSDRLVRAMAIRGLGDLGELTPVESLIETLQDPCWEVRVEGAYALGKVEARRVP